MNALAGWVSKQTAPQAASSCATILESQQAYFTSDRSIEADACAALGAASSLLHPADRPGAVLAFNERLIVAADCRIDNRGELASALGLERSGLAGLSDCALILLGWTKWREGLLPRLDGDFAIAAYERAGRRLVLARDAGGQRPLFLAKHRDGLAFASMPIGLLAEPNLRRGWNMEGFVSSLGDRLTSELTYFNGIDRLMPAHCAIVEDSRLRIERWWNPSFEPLRMSDEQWVDAYRHELSRAVGSKIRDRGPVIASHLSAGWDSSAVTAAAARLRPESVLAYTAAPDANFAGPVPRGRIADESALAAATAAHLGIEHHILRSAPLTFDYLEQQAINYQEPARNLINAAWNGKIHRHASERGAVVLLNGQLGNLTLNFGGIEALPYWLDQVRIGDWWRQAKAAVDRGDVRWRGALFNSFQSWLPAPVWRQLRRAGMKANRDTGFFLHPDLREAVRSAQATPPPHNPSSDRMTMIGKLDHGMYTKGMIAEVGMEDIDPLADRRLMEFSLRLPPEQMLDRGLDRPLARRALASWLPASFFDSKPRGIQAADWPIRFPRSHAEEAYEAIESNAGVATILDLKRIREAIRRWPRDDTEILDGWDRYSRMLPIALATGVFVKAFTSMVSESPSAEPSCSETDARGKSRGR